MNLPRPSHALSLPSHALSLQSNALRLSLLALAAIASVSITGCGMTAGNVGQAVTASPAVSTTMTGLVHGGLQPVSGALIQLYEVGSTGYTSAAKPILTTAVTTNSTGSFSITGDYTCDAGSYVYITASGGNPGSGANNNLALMAALGSCSALKTSGASTYVWINEVTTTAAAYALAQFSGGTTFGASLVAQPGSGGTTAPADNFATSATNIQGVANAMGVARVLANTSTGTSPGSNSNGTATVENYTINTIADILSTCVNSTGGAAGTATPCGTLFTDATPVGGAAPADTIQVALQLALHPGDANLLAGTPTGSTLDALIGAQPPYKPYINTTIAGNSIPDWTIGVSYAPVIPNTSTAILNASNYVAIDAYGNAWITNTGGKSVVELAPNGDPIQAGTGTGLYSVTSYSVGGAATAITGGSAPGATFFGLALDNSNNAWAADYGSGNLFKITGSGASFGVNGEIATSNGGGGAAATSLYTGSASAHPIAIAFDPANDLFATLYGNGGASPAGGTGCGTYTSGTKNIVTFPYLSGSSAYGSIIYGSSGGSNQTYIAIDNGNTDVVSGPPASTIPGSPFVWWIAEASDSGEIHPSGGASGHYGLLYQAYTGTTGASPQGCNTAIGSISSTNATPTTKLALDANSGDAADPINNAFAVAFDASNNLWTASQLPVDANGTFTTSFTRITSGYGNSFSSANYAASSSYVVYDTGGMLASGFKPQAVAVDGASNVYSANIGTKPIITAITNAGVGLAPSSTGFTGATFSPDGTSYQLARPFNAASQLAIDPSGNIWVTNGAATAATSTAPILASVPATNVVQIVGVAVPVQTPIAAAVTKDNIGAKP